jgi:phospholipase C
MRSAEIPNDAAGLDHIDHVVVLMLENRSLDNLLGYLYPQGVPADAPLGTTFNGVLNPDGSAKPLFNPIPGDAVNKPDHGLQIVKVGPVAPDNFNQPFPDPGEEYAFINTQLFNLIDGGTQSPPYNLPPGTQTPTMDGFIMDYIRNFKEIESPGFDPDHKGRDPTFDEYAQIMQCYTPDHLPVVSTLAREFAVFDHWFCAVPSQTLCNRAFWHAGTSWGLVVNDPTDAWKANSDAPTVFNQISESGSALDWRIYSDNSQFYCLTQFLHAKALEPFAGSDHFKSLEDFEADCANGKLPAYSFLEPRFVNPHNDMHPSSTSGQIDGDDPASSMTMGELLVWRIYEAVRTSATAEGSNAQNTLLIITFDEAGGTYDHVAPPAAVPPDLGAIPPQDGFDYKRLGIRVPTIMISARIAPNTVVNAPMDHNSFINTLRRKWEAIAPGKFPALTARIAASPDFAQVFTACEPRLANDWPVIPKPVVAIPPHDPTASMNALQKSCAAAVASLKVDGHPAFV